MLNTKLITSVTISTILLGVTSTAFAAARSQMQHDYGNQTNSVLGGDLQAAMPEDCVLNSALDGKAYCFDSNFQGKRVIAYTTKGHPFRARP
jgi:hypothetical protein